MLTKMTEGITRHAWATMGSHWLRLATVCVAVVVLLFPSNTAMSPIFAATATEFHQFHEDRLSRHPHQSELSDHGFVSQSEPSASHNRSLGMGLHNPIPNVSKNNHGGAKPLHHRTHGTPALGGPRFLRPDVLNPVSLRIPYPIPQYSLITPAKKKSFDTTEAHPKEISSSDGSADTQKWTPEQRLSSMQPTEAQWLPPGYIPSLHVLPVSSSKTGGSREPTTRQDSYSLSSNISSRSQHPPSPVPEQQYRLPNYLPSGFKEIAAFRRLQRARGHGGASVPKIRRLWSQLIEFANTTSPSSSSVPGYLFPYYYYSAALSAPEKPRVARRLWQHLDTFVNATSTETAAPPAYLFPHLYSSRTPRALHESRMIMRQENLDNQDSISPPSRRSLSTSPEEKGTATIMQSFRHRVPRRFRMHHGARHLTTTATTENETAWDSGAAPPAYNFQKKNAGSSSHLRHLSQRRRLWNLAHFLRGATTVTLSSTRTSTSRPSYRLPILTEKPRTASNVRRSLSELPHARLAESEDRRVSLSSVRPRHLWSQLPQFSNITSSSSSVPGYLFPSLYSVSGARSRRLWEELTSFANITSDTDTKPPAYLFPSLYGFSSHSHRGGSSHLRNHPQRRRLWNLQKGDAPVMKAASASLPSSRTFTAKPSYRLPIPYHKEIKESNIKRNLSKLPHAWQTAAAGDSGGRHGSLVAVRRRLWSPLQEFSNDTSSSSVPGYLFPSLYSLSGARPRRLWEELNSFANVTSGTETRPPAYLFPSLYGFSSNSHRGGHRSLQSAGCQHRRLWSQLNQFTNAHTTIHSPHPGIQHNTIPYPPLFAYAPQKFLSLDLTDSGHD
eukprot:GHVQ01026977.1.p1 GENE.GHVQ01026977.1~~GHVQ01026977.1.p1  ORF type:complete len:839 (+),score=59.70 GHVQ01026977.1:3346-5862(+)